MKRIAFVITIFFIIPIAALPQKRYVPAVIFDSDMGPDYDDVGAMAMLHAFADSGFVKILATVASTKYEGVAGVFDVLNTYFNRPDLPIGLPKTNGLQLKDPQHWTDSLLANYPHDINTNEQVPDAVEVYRKTLARQPDRSVTIITVGFLTNLANLLNSAPDQYSSLTGRELVQRKVRQLVSMAGRFPSGKEFNVEKDAGASQLVFISWPTPILFTGFEIGEKIKVGVPLMSNTNIQLSPVKDVFRISIPKAKGDSAGRMSWDETAVLVAIKDYKRYYNICKGQMTVAEDGSNRWNRKASRHAYLVQKIPPSQVQAYIEKLIAHQPISNSKGDK